MLEVLVKFLSSLLQIWSSLSEDQKESICKVFTDLMDQVFREYFRANTGGAQ